MHADGKSTLASVSKWNSGKVNYMAVSPPTVERVRDGNLNPPTTKKANPEQITFTNVPPRRLGRRGSCDVIKGKPGVTGQAEHAKSPKEGFDLLMVNPSYR